MLHGGKSVSENRCQKPGESGVARLTRVDPTAATLTLLTAGLCTLVADHGRPATRSLGVPVGGAADRSSLALGNGLVGNPPAAAALEIALAGPTLRATAPLACVLFGAPFAVTTDRRPLTAGTTFTLRRARRCGSAARRAACSLPVRGRRHPHGPGPRQPLVAGAAARGAALPCRAGAIHGRSLACPRTATRSGRTWRGRPSRRCACVPSPAPRPTGLRPTSSSTGGASPSRRRPTAWDCGCWAGRCACRRASWCRSWSVRRGAGDARWPVRGARRRRADGRRLPEGGAGDRGRPGPGRPGPARGPRLV